MIKLLLRIFFFNVICGIVFLFILNFSTPLQIATSTPDTTQEITPSYLYLVFIDPAFSPIERDLIVKGVHDWKVKTNGIIQYFIVGSGVKLPDAKMPPVYKSVLFKRTDPDMLIVVIIDNAIKGDMLGYADVEDMAHDDMPTILLVPDRISSYNEFQEVVQHEFGHLIFLRHNTHAHTLMWRAVEGSAPCITQVDLMEFCKIYHCDDEKFLGCSEAPEWLMCYARPEPETMDGGAPKKE